KPGSGAMLGEPLVRIALAQAVGASSLDGFDPASWTYLLIASIDDSPAVAVVSKVSDAKKLAAGAGDAQVSSKGGGPVVGAQPVVDGIGGFARSAIATQRPPSTLTATIYVPQIAARFKQQIEEVRRQMSAGLASSSLGGLGQMMNAYADGLASVIADTDK